MYTYSSPACPDRTIQNCLQYRKCLIDRIPPELHAHLADDGIRHGFTHACNLGVEGAQGVLSRLEVTWVEGDAEVIFIVLLSIRFHGGVRVDGSI